MKIIVTSHGELCTGVINSYEMLAGKNENIIAVSLKDSDTGEFKSNLGNLIKNSQEDLLIICDIYGGTPYNEAYYHFIQRPEQIRVVTGLNLPMLLETGLSLNGSVSLDGIVNVAMESGVSAVKSAETEETKVEEISDEDMF